MYELKNYRMEQSIFIDIENDPNETGLVGEPFSLITTDEGDLDAKLTTLDPNFSAIIVDLMYQLNLSKNDTVAILMTGSMPGANIAVLTACKSLGLYPVTISSVGASQWGANQIDFTWLDMEKILFDREIIPSQSVAASIGEETIWEGFLSPSGRKIIVENIKKHNIPLIKKNRLNDNILNRMEQYKNFASIDSYKAVINIGGGVASLGTSFNLKLLSPGVVNRSDINKIERSEGIEGVFTRFIKSNVSGLHILNIRPLIEKYKMQFAPIPLPQIGLGSLYAVEKYNLIVVAFCLLLIVGIVFLIGFKVNKK